MMEHGILSRINYGYQELEPLLLGLAAMRRSFLLLGRHGTGKTRLARHLSMAWGEDSFGFYDATKDDLISIAGIPDPEGMKQGDLRFVSHQRTIWDKKTIVVDEITRAAKENQNLWLEIIEDRKCFGTPVDYELLIATANPESYAAAFQLDEALLDRFHAVIPVPELQNQMRSDDVSALLALSLSSDLPLPRKEFVALFGEIRNHYAGLLENGSLANVKDYVAALVPPLLVTLQEQDAPFLSPRTYARNFPETILATAAAMQALGRENPLVAAAELAGRYSIGTRLQLHPSLMNQLHRECAFHLEAGSETDEQRLRMGFATLSTFEQKLHFLKEHWVDIGNVLSRDELEKEIGDMLHICLKKSGQAHLLRLMELLEGVGFQGDARRQAEGKLLISLKVGIDRVREQICILESGEQDPLNEIEQFNLGVLQGVIADKTFLSSNRPEWRAVKGYIISMRNPNNPDALKKLRCLLSRPRLFEAKPDE